jgi:hypothetical protein
MPPQNKRRQALLLVRRCDVAHHSSIQQLADLVEVTYAAVRSDAYLAAMTVYQSAKLAGKGTGLDGTLDDLGRRFMRKSGDDCPALSR